MKFKKLVLLGSIVLGLTPLCNAQLILGSSHDFSNSTTRNLTGELCIVCHAPHGTDATQVPLWNHATTQQIFSTYTGYKFQGIATITQPDGASKLCLSCHDGITAMNQFGGKMQGSTGTPALMNGFRVLGTNLTNDHPISFKYDANLASLDGRLKDPTIALSGLGGTIADDLLDIQGKVQCPTCHEVHDPTIYKFGKMSNAGSALCLTCHNK